ncbi:hypothetical protein [Streptomyces sp. MK7]|uniref:hypothetical protein n=1 Tax=Streptomyces sp. MK7 TaxID=3067635 RepID=UPI00292D9246|nr:hypothetical protein [Streptomyces sp. MK7]
MQWRDDSGGAYVEDPYGGAPVYAYGHEYAHGHTYGHDQPYVYDEAYGYGHAYGHGVGAAPTDTATLYPPCPTEPQWTYPDDGTHGDVLSDALSDVLTVPPQEFEPPGLPAQGPDTSASASARPVFVDSSGRRQRRVLRAARLLMIPAGGYVALLVSAMLGGPSISSPFVPQPDPAHPATPRATAPDSAPGSGQAAGNTSATAARQSTRPTARQTSGATDRPVAAPTSGSGATAPTGITSPTSTATSAPVPAPSSKGRAYGSTHKPVK